MRFRHERKTYSVLSAAEMAAEFEQDYSLPRPSWVVAPAGLFRACLGAAMGEPDQGEAVLYATLFAQEYSLRQVTDCQKAVRAYLAAFGPKCALDYLAESRGRIYDFDTDVLNYNR